MRSAYIGRPRDRQGAGKRRHPEQSSGMDRRPDLITHNFDPAWGPFRNLCAEGPDAARTILGGIASAGRRVVKPNYLPRRLATEAWLHARATEKLGSLGLANPIYFFLGDMADGADPSRPWSFRMPLAGLDPGAVTFTYPDSMASMPLGHREDLRAERQSYHGQVFSLDEIDAVIAVHGLPGDRWKHDPSRRFDRFIEVQVWDDRVLRPFRDHWPSPTGWGRASCIAASATPLNPPCCTSTT